MKLEIVAKKRALQGRGASRRLRRAGMVPGVVYGGGKEAVSIELAHQDLMMQFHHETLFSSILSLSIDGKTEQVLLRDYQAHPVRHEIQHIDFQRVSTTEPVHMKVPLHFINQETSPGVKLGHGIVSHVLTEVDIRCLPKHLPEFINVDIGAMQLGESLHLSDLKLPKGIELSALLHGDDATVVSILAPKVDPATSTSDAADDDTDA